MNTAIGSSLATIEKRHFESADEFLNALRRSDRYWLPADHWEVPWIFRGQREADWRLLPSAWREGVELDELYKDINGSDLDDIVRQTIDYQTHTGVRIDQHEANVRRLIVQNRYEFLVARAFAELVDDLGLPLPGGPLPRKISHDPFRWATETEPFHPTVALAQHHGMRTRLLDWTHNPLTAAFFAADGTRSDEGGNIAVWAVSRAALVQYECREFNVPRSQIGYLHAQEALFTYSLIADHWFLMNGRWPCLEELLPPQSLRQLTLPKLEVPKLQRLLWAERISKAHLMPSLDNVTRALRLLWKEALTRT